MSGVALLLFACSIFCPAEERRRVTVEDAITMTRWVDLGSSSIPQVALFSPDHKQFVVLVKRGNLRRNTNDYSLLYFRLSGRDGRAESKTLVTMSSSSMRDGIRDVRWLEDNRTLTFLGEGPRENPAVYRLDVLTRGIEKLTNHPTPIVAYDIRGDGRELVYEAVPPCTSWMDSEEVREHGIEVEAQYPSELLAEACPKEGTLKINRELYVQFIGHRARKVTTSYFLTETQPLSLSPDGRYAVLIAYVGEVPPAWTEYEDELLRPYLREKHQRGQLTNIEQYVLLDVQSNTLGPLIDGPRKWQSGAVAWSEDSRSVIVSGAYLPLQGQAPSEVARRKQHAFVTQVQLPGKEITEITDQNFAVVRWDHATGQLLLTPSAMPSSENIAAFEHSSSGWLKAAREASTPVKKVPLVTVEEDLNTPPRIFISQAGKATQELIDLNPQFAHLLFGRVEPITWKASDGHLVAGGLYLPPDYQPGRRYPLVIQTHGFNPHEFWIDGPFPSAFAAQPLAAKDIVVLQVGNSVDIEEDHRFVNTPDEAPRKMAAFEGAIEELDRRGVIDRHRVGIIGFSRTVFHVEYALTHSRYQFRAASVADGFDAGLVNYLLWRSADYLKVNKGDPLAGGLEAWVSRSPGFAIDKVMCPVHMEYYGLAGVLGAWQWFSSLQLLKKPVDFLWLPRGKHTLVLPWERRASLETNVDWFDYWLNDKIDPDPTKVEQYRRWQELRTQSTGNSTGEN